MVEFVTRYRRYAQITAAFARHDFGYLSDRMGFSKLFTGDEALSPYDERTEGETPSQPIRPLSAPERLRMVCEELGPTFIKMGQILSTRPDLLPKPYITELRKLQDHASKIPFEEVKEVVETEMGKELKEIFPTFEEKPLAAASIAQVHRCTLPDGTQAVAKVLRPGIEEQIRMDLSILYGMARLANRSRFAETIDKVRVIQEFERVILRELDFVAEGQLTEEFARNFQDDSKVHIARIFWDYSAQRLLTMEFLDGVNISQLDVHDKQEVDTRELAKMVVMVTLKQIFRDGLFHADPHPGNLMLLPDGVLGILDFGMIGRFDRHTLAMLRAIVFDVIQRDHVSMAAHLLDYDIVGHDVDMRKLREDLRLLFRNIASMPRAQASEALQSFVIEHELHIPADLFLLDKTFGTLDGTIRLLDPRFDLQAVAEDFGAEEGMKVLDIETMAKELGMRIFRDADAIVEMPVLLRRIMRRVDEGHFATRTRIQIDDKTYARLNKLGLNLFTGATGIAALIFAWFTRAATDILLPFGIKLPSLLLVAGGLLVFITTWSLWKGKKL
ncbi:MAG: AarF/UbiB family protein [Xanthomonadales bacterium]|nr:AarF/UbiB family protein [Xanthomonadales bacterium]